MGYTTNFKGILEFTKELTAKQLALLNKILGEDCRDHPEWKNAKDLYVIDLELNDDFSGLQWTGAEKTYDMDKLVNVVTHEMRRQYPDFCLKGKLLAQGEEIDDRWELCIGREGMAYKKELKLKGKKVKCPHCEETFILEEEN